jgi:hypothetical protein
LSNVAIEQFEIAPNDAQLALAAGVRDGRRLPWSLKLKPLERSEFLELQIPAREMLLSPTLPAKGLAMLYAARSVGKTRVALGIALAVATGGQFLNWSSTKPRRVLCIDGGLPDSDLQTRLREVIQ